MSCQMNPEALISDMVSLIEILNRQGVRTLRDDGQTIKDTPLKKVLSDEGAAKGSRGRFLSSATLWKGFLRQTIRADDPSCDCGKAWPATKDWLEMTPKDLAGKLIKGAEKCASS